MAGLDRSNSGYLHSNAGSLYGHTGTDGSHLPSGRPAIRPAFIAIHRAPATEPLLRPPMRPHRRFLPPLPLVLLGLLTASGCSPGGLPLSGGGDASGATDFEDVFILQLGDEREIPGTRLRLGFLGVLEDSRCPTDVECVWEGDAELQLSLTTETGSREVFSLHTTLEPRAALRGGAYIELVELTPHPTQSAPITPGSYRAEFEFDASRSLGVP
jgi:hypothetical protein